MGMQHVIYINHKLKSVYLFTMPKTKKVMEGTLSIAELEDLIVNFPNEFSKSREWLGIQNKTSHPIKSKCFPLGAKKQKTTG